MEYDNEYFHHFLSYDEFSSYENSIDVMIDDADDNNDINEIADLMANLLNTVVKDADKMAVQKMNELAKALLDEEKEFTFDDALAFKKLADEQHLHVMLLYAELEENVMKEKAARKVAEEQAAFANALAMALELELLAAAKEDLVEEEDDDITFLNTILQEVLHFVKDQPLPPSRKHDLSFFDDDEDDDVISFLPEPKRLSPSPQFDNADDFFLFYVPPDRCLPPLLVELNEDRPPPLLVELNEDKYLPLEFNPLPILKTVSYSPINVPFDKDTMLFDFIVEDPEMDTLINFV